ncbi:MAG: hypothetical protein ACE5R4_14305 [Armatimonadota bacterium]
MSATRPDKRYDVHFLIARDEGGYSALCYEYTTAGFGKDPLSALCDAALATAEYLDYMCDEGREGEAARPAPAELILKFADQEIGETVTQEQLDAAIGKLMVAQVQMERKMQIAYDVASRQLRCESHEAFLATSPGDLASYPAELVIAGG